MTLGETKMSMTLPLHHFDDKQLKPSLALCNNPRRKHWFKKSASVVECCAIQAAEKETSCLTLSCWLEPLVHTELDLLVLVCTGQSLPVYGRSHHPVPSVYESRHCSLISVRVTNFSKRNINVWTSIRKLETKVLDANPTLCKIGVAATRT